MKIASLANLPAESNSHNPKVLKKVLIRNGQVPNLTTFAQAVFPPGEVASEHTHQDMYEIFFVDTGIATFKINGTPHQLEEGSCITVEPGEAHEVSNQSNTDIIITYFGVEIPKS